MLRRKRAHGSSSFDDCGNNPLENELLVMHRNDVHDLVGMHFTAVG